MSHTNRVILLIDMDCFYCQVEENLNPIWKGKPLAVVQYNQWRGGGIIAVNYPARDKGVTRHMRGNDAKEKCPEIILAKVPEVRGKADLTKYREAGKRVADVLQTFSPHLERASVDEAYLDITSVVEKRIEEGNDEITVERLENTFVVGNTTLDFIENVTRHRAYSESNFKLALGGIIAEEIRAEVFRVTGYRCSAGVAHNKILAKLVCGLHKPNKQTILPHEAVSVLYKNLPIRKIKSLGGKFGNMVVEKLGIENMGELIKFSQRELSKKFDEKSASWLYNIARGIDHEPVTTRLISKSIGCCKRFQGKTALCTKEDVEHWLNELAEEMAERLEKDLDENGRKARQMVVSFAHETEADEVNGTKTHPLNSYEKKKIFENAYKVVQKNCMKEDGSYHVTFLGISVGNFQDVKKIKEITSFFKTMRENNTIKETQLKENMNMQTNESNITEKVDKNISFESAASIKTTEEIDDSANNSIYSQTTEEGSPITSENLVFYEQVHPQSRENQNYNISTSKVIELSNEDSDISHDSITEELNNFQEKEEEKPQTSPVVHSFFNRYFNNISGKRDIENTKSGEEIEETDDKTNGSDDLEINEVSHSVEVTEEPVIIKEEEQNNSTCPQCGKIINPEEYQSHLDYHFAISIVKNEAHLYKNEVVPKPKVLPEKSGSTKKKKTDSATSSNASFKPIGAYFKNNVKEKSTDDVGPREECGECKKRVALSEWDVHMDFHAAKKLHLEMNSAVQISKPVEKSKVTNKAVKSKFKGQKGIVGFLKSV